MSTTVRLAIERLRNTNRNSPEIRVLRKIVPSGCTAIDVGANLGLFTLYLQPLAKKVISFEPLPALVEILHEKYKGLNVEVRNLALGSEKGNLVLKTPFVGDKELHEWSSLSTDLLGKTWAGQAITRVEQRDVLVSTLSDEAPENVGFVKIDVEGFEEEVIEGGKEFLEKQKPNLLVEIEQRHTGNDIRIIFEKLYLLGYKGYYSCQRKWHHLEDFDPDRFQDPQNADGFGIYINNFVFVNEKIGVSL